MHRSARCYGSMAMTGSSWTRARRGPSRSAPRTAWPPSSPSAAVPSRHHRDASWWRRFEVTRHRSSRTWGPHGHASKSRSGGTDGRGALGRASGADPCGGAGARRGRRGRSCSGGLSGPSLRELHLLPRHCTDAAVHCELWRDLTRRAPAEVRDVPATMLAVSSWLDGDGAMAWAALDEVKDRDSRLAQWLELLLRNAVDPQVWEGWRTPSSASSVWQARPSQGAKRRAQHHGPGPTAEGPSIGV